jgi:HEAT repeat protein
MASLEEVEAWLARLEASGLEGDRDAFHGLGRLTHESAHAVPPLLTTLRNSASRWRADAARWLSHVGYGSVEVANALSDALQDGDDELVDAALMSIGYIGVANDAIRERLTVRMRTGRSTARVLAASSLLLLEPEKFQPHLQPLQAIRDMHEHESLFVRDRAVYVLVRLFDAIPSTIDDAIAFLDDDYDPIPELIARELADQPEDVVIPRLLEIVRTGTPKLRAGALFALREPRPRIRDALRAEVADMLIATRVFEYDESPVRDANTRLRLAANVAKSLQLDVPIVIEKLRVLLDDCDSWVAEQAAKALLSMPNISEATRETATRTLRRVHE